MVVKTANEATMTDTTIFMSLRFALAAAVFAPFFKPDARVFKAGVQVGVWYAAGYIAQVRGAQHPQVLRRQKSKGVQY
jgi:hypothetical protein